MVLKRITWKQFLRIFFFFLNTNLHKAVSHEAGIKGSGWWCGGLGEGPIALDALCHEIHA